MKLLTHWNPLRDMQEFNRALNSFQRSIGGEGRSEATAVAEWVPVVDVLEDEKEYLIKAELPEMKKDDVKVEVLDGVLTIEGERAQEKEEKGKKFHKVERSYGKFVRQFALPAEVEAAKVEAEYKDGVLNVHLPKTAVTKPTTVTVKVA